MPVWVSVVRATSAHLILEKIVGLCFFRPIVLCVPGLDLSGGWNTADGMPLLSWHVSIIGMSLLVVLVCCCTPEDNPTRSKCGQDKKKDRQQW